MDYAVTYGADPLIILLMKEGSVAEAYELESCHRAGLARRATSERERYVPGHMDTLGASPFETIFTNTL